MRVSTVYIRFYRAFNFDYLRKHHKDAVADPWDQYNDLFYPYVKIDLDPMITCVVGANESGKSQLLDAIEHALGVREPAEAADFCRYSQFFTVDATPRTPHFGLRLSDLTEADRTAIGALLKAEPDESYDSIRIFREDPGFVKLFVGDNTTPIIVNDDEHKDFFGALPRSFRIDPAKPIPDSVPIEYIVQRSKESVERVISREDRWLLIDLLVRGDGLRSALAKDPPDTGLLKSLLARADSLMVRGDEKQNHRDQLHLAFDLLVTVGGVDVSTFTKLEQALRAQNEGFANGIVAAINRQLSEALNLHRWWTQDEKFELQVAARDFDLVFTIRDRTSSEYSFAERSSGLKYFLSYLVQYLAHLARGNSAGLLLMDEPDAFLSNQGQQDLLRLFQDFAGGSDEVLSRQVAFVTHSPFFIDKNRADRVRVLDKGADDEGTRVVRDVGRNHFEPLRSAFGGYVGEATFIGNCNLMLEGVADQVYVAGISSALLRRDVPGAERLDLNDLTLVPAGSASHIPYMTFLARGRDADQPSVIVLLDGGEAGNDALKDLVRGGPKGKRMLDPRFVLQISKEALPEVVCERPGGPQEIEDLLPSSVIVQACESYVAEVGRGQSITLTTERIVSELSKSVGMFKATEKALKAAGSTLRLDKVGLARHVVRVLNEGCSTGADTVGADIARQNFIRLFVKLGERQRLAVNEKLGAAVGARIDRVVRSFLADHKSSATRSDLKIFLEKVEALLDSTLASEEIRKQIHRLQVDHSLTSDLGRPVIDYEKVRGAIGSIKYAGLLASQGQ